MIECFGDIPVLSFSFCLQSQFIITINRYFCHTLRTFCLSPPLRHRF